MADRNPIMSNCAKIAPLLLFPTMAIAGEATPAANATWLSLVPALLAIAMALATRSVIPSLAAGIVAGAWIIHDLSLIGLFQGFLDMGEIYVVKAMADADHAAIILFSLMIGGMVGIISRNGGMQGVVNRLSRWVHDVRQAMLATATLGVAIFFDDYANSLVVGNTMRPVTDRMRVSREKLAYLVDATSAPVACLAFATTWIGYEVGLIQTAIADLPKLGESAYAIFIEALPFNFYPLLALVFVYLIAHTGRDFGPMHVAESRAAKSGDTVGPAAEIDEEAADGKDLQPVANRPHRARNAIIPVFVLVSSVMASLVVTGHGDTFREIIGSANSYQSLVWGSLLGVASAFAVTLLQGLLGLEETVMAWYNGIKTMMLAIIILILAWSLAAVNNVLGTDHFLIAVLGDSLPDFLLPTLVFVLSAATAFSTGSSWGTMGILYPLVIPLSWAVLGHADPVFFATVASVLSGAVWGDHCSPISDTTILSSMASGCDHIAHVRTQLPYALVVGAVAIIAGTLPAGFGLSWWVTLPLGMLSLYVVLRWLGRPIEGRGSIAAISE